MPISLKRVFFIFAMLVVAGSVTFAFVNKPENTQQEFSSTIQSEELEQTYPPEASAATKKTSVEIHSPDGKNKIIMNRKDNPDGTTAYSFTTSDINGDNSKEIFSKTLSTNQSMDIPYNSWSPNNKYVFLKEENSGFKNFYVFNADGTPFSNGAYINVVPTFIAKDTGTVLADVTGWDSNTLLHVKSNENDGTRGPTFWFEIPSQAIIRLASR